MGSKERFRLPDDYDVLIIGAGLAGLTAGMYASRQGLKTAIMERMIPGNQIINVDLVVDYPGFVNGISGAELGSLVYEQAQACGAEFLMEEVVSLSRAGTGFVLKSLDETYRARTVIIAAGSSFKKLGINGEEQFYNMGLSHCASCDGPLFEGQTVGVVGGGDSAVTEALILSQFASKVIVLHSNSTLHAMKIIQDVVIAEPKISVLHNISVEEIIGDERVTGVSVRSTESQLVDQIDLAGLFVYVGLEPNSGIVANIVDLDPAGHIPVNINMETMVCGLFAAGDIRQNASAQLISAAGDGATAAISAYRYLSSMGEL
ncbi:FAD-binding protein [SAR202 cluster bacterium AD-804-J14_MRT_500m]|nr:FAD-binding protein [SAR202 cluster bacterium AD-804-J14_MRT_500m]